VGGFAAVRTSVFVSYKFSNYGVQLRYKIKFYDDFVV
jgi:hypothetical protein